MCSQFNRESALFVQAFFRPRNLNLSTFLKKFFQAFTFFIWNWYDSHGSPLLVGV